MSRILMLLAVLGFCTVGCNQTGTEGGGSDTPAATGDSGDADAAATDGGSETTDAGEGEDSSAGN